MGFNFAGNGGFAGEYNNSGSPSFIQLLKNYIGQTVIVFTTSGGPSGCGFEGVLMDVNCKFIRLSNHQGTPPANPLSESICGQPGFEPLNGTLGCAGAGAGAGLGKMQYFTVGSVCDIPIEKIVAFCHNAV